MHDATIIEAVRSHAVPVDVETAAQRLLEAIDLSVSMVLIGEATHGTQEFYRIRADLTRALVRQRGFDLVDGGGALTRWTQVRLKSATSEVDAALFEFLEEGQSLCARRPVALRIQQTHTGAVQALEIDTVDGQFIRLAFRATALPEQLDGLAPGELAFAERSPEPTGALAAATLPIAKNGS